MPSRQFMVQQATLTALEACYPNIVRLQGRRAVADRMARLIESDFTEAHDFAFFVAVEMGRLSIVHSVAA